MYPYSGLIPFFRLLAAPIPLSSLPVKNWNSIPTLPGGWMYVKGGSPISNIKNSQVPSEWSIWLFHFCPFYALGCAFK